MQRRVPDIAKIKNALDWAPINTLENIISDVAQDMKK
jgi:UDP-glucose 4-epimerase